MHDPSTVAFQIKSPFRGKPSKFWPKGYRGTLVTIWHEDPMDFEGKCGCRRDDDSCGWFSPPYSEPARDRIRKLGSQEFFDLFRKRDQIAKGDPEKYAYVCYEPSAYDAVYWAWRAIKQSEQPRGRWKYGDGRGFLAPGELEAIYMLASDPVDNVRVTVAGIKNAESCADFFCLIYRAYLRHHRPWYKHPRWHVWHWRFQIHPWQTLRRWLFSHCAGCGKRFLWGYSPIGFQWDPPKPKPFCSEVGVYHSECANLVTQKPQGTA